MNKNNFIQQNTSLSDKAIQNTLSLLSEGATIPFIARYRKERTGGLDETEIQAIRDFSVKYDEITSRQQTIIKAIDEQGKLSAELSDKIISTFDLNVLEDLYLPYKQKRLTKGEKAKQQGLEPLAKMIMSQRGGDPESMADRFVKGEINDVDEAIQGAIYIIAEWINENSALRGKLRNLFERKSIIQTKLVKGKEDEGEKYKDYFDFNEPLYKVPSHRFLAIIRADREGIIRMRVRPETDEAIQQVERFFVKGNDACAEVVGEACKDAYKRLLEPSLENEIIQVAKEKADIAAIQIFNKNLKQLLLASPLGNKRILAIDPGFRTGCKVVCLSETGELLTNATIYPHPPQKEESKAKAKLAQLVQAYNIEAIAIGDGTAGRETERLVKNTGFDREVNVFVVREDGASIYSASPIARKEFPDYDVTVRGAVSIGRRLMDPLAELVKIDPKSIGVGQYQHEVDQKLLKEALDEVVLSSVNAVGVDLNTASPYLLSYVSGLGPAIAENIVAYRNEKGEFKERKELLSVPRLGQKAYEQAAGFLRVNGGVNPLDASAVHPESYGIVNTMAKKLGVKLEVLIGDEAKIESLKQEDFKEVDAYTFKDIIEELKKPGRDPRKQAKVWEFDASIRTIQDLKIGMKLNGIVTNVTAFGAFVNIGIKENGLIHKSNLANVYVDDPAKFIALHDHVLVEVMEVDEARKRVGLKRLKRTIKE